tara:strand:+ start:9595 stop:10686 length:1092 start_codon:yes stop_codon:yes gene_type:complete
MEELVLSQAQQQSILKSWNDAAKENQPPPSLSDLIKSAFPNIENADGRTKEGRAVRAFLNSRKLKARTSRDPERELVISEEQKEFIKNNAQMMKAADMAKVLFNNPSLTHLSLESRKIQEYANTLETSEVYSEEEIAPRDFKPPKRFDTAIARINKYVMNGVDKEKISLAQKKSINSLIEYMHTFRFTHQINNYETVTERELFESSFVRYTWDKADLTQEEVDQYIVLSTEVVIASNIQNRINTLQEHLDESATDTEGRRISMSLVESISTCTAEYNQCVNRQQKLLNDLKEKRSARLSKQIKEHASILNLVEMWKDEENRKKMIHLAEMRKKAIKEEVDRLTDMDEIKARIMGLSEEEAIDG